MHHGGMLLIVRGGERISQLDGKYWTDRNSSGSISAVARSRVIAHGFKEAAKLPFRPSK